MSYLPKSSDAEKFQEHSINSLQSAGMSLSKWQGNTITCSPEAGSKVLGMAWSTEGGGARAGSDISCSQTMVGEVFDLVLSIESCV